MRTSNPVLQASTFQPSIAANYSGETMSIHGTVNKTLISLILLFIAAFYTWSLFFSSVAAHPYEVGQSVSSLKIYLWGGMIGGLITAMIIIFKKTWAPLLVPVYAIMEGLCLGALSATFEVRFPGIVIQAVSLTFFTLLALLFIYKSGMIKVTDKFKLGVTAATGGIALFYLTQMVLGFFSVHIPYIHEGGFIGIGFSLFVIIVASLNLVMDFDFIEKQADHRAPKYMEWVGAFGLLVTLIWLYLEFLRLLSKLQGRK